MRVMKPDRGNREVDKLARERPASLGSLRLIIPGEWKEGERVRVPPPDHLNVLGDTQDLAHVGAEVHVVSLSWRSLKLCTEVALCYLFISLNTYLVLLAGWEIAMLQHRYSMLLLLFLYI